MSLYFFFIGNLFHVDFGYILGRDPKPLPPPMKLSKEMVNGTIDLVKNQSLFTRIALTNDQ